MGKTEQHSSAAATPVGPGDRPGRIPFRLLNRLGSGGQLQSCLARHGSRFGPIRMTFLVQVPQQGASTSVVTRWIVRKSILKQRLSCWSRVFAEEPERPDRASPRKRNTRFKPCIASKYVDVVPS